MSLFLKLTGLYRFCNREFKIWTMGCQNTDWINFLIINLTLLLERPRILLQNQERWKTKDFHQSHLSAGQKEISFLILIGSSIFRGWSYRCTYMYYILYLDIIIYSAIMRKTRVHYLCFIFLLIFTFSISITDQAVLHHVQLYVRILHYHVLRSFSWIAN